MSSQKAMINTLMFYHWDDTLFDGMHLPVGVDRDDVVKSILLETSDFPIIITDLQTLKLAIEIWSKHKVSIWEHLLSTTRYVYNPIENYNRLEVETTHLEKRGTGSIKGDGGADTTTYNVSESGSVADSTRENETDSRTSTTNNVEAHSGEDVRNVTETVTESNGGSDTRTINETVAEVNSGDDGTSVTGTTSKTKTGTDELNSTESTTISHTGSDTVLEGVSAFNEQNVFSDHTRTETVFNSGETRNNTRDDVTTYDTTETETVSTDTTVTYGKETDTTKTVSDGLSYGKETDTSTTSTERQSYGEKVETDTAISDSGSREKTGSLNRTLGNTKTGTETHTHSQGNIETRNFDDDFTAERHVTGNIGVMTTQDMIKQEREIALFDIIDVIVADYKSEFCILIY